MFLVSLRSLSLALALDFFRGKIPGFGDGARKMDAGAGSQGLRNAACVHLFLNSVFNDVMLVA